MEKIKEKILRRISFTYKELSNLFELPKTNFTMSIYREKVEFWDEEDLTHWEIKGTTKEVEEKIGLLKGEKVIKEDYWVFQGYHLIIETTKENLNKIKMNLPRRLIFKLNPKDLTLREWRRFSP